MCVRVCVCVCARVRVPQHVFTGQKTIYRSWFFPSTLCVLEVNLRLSVLSAHIFTCWTIYLLGPWEFFCLIYSFIFILRLGLIISQLTGNLHCRPGYPTAHWGLPVCALQVLALKVCTTMPSFKRFLNQAFRVYTDIATLSFCSLIICHLFRELDFMCIIPIFMPTSKGRVSLLKAFFCRVISLSFPKPLSKV